MKNKKDLNHAYVLEQKISETDQSADFRELAWASKLKLAVGEKKRIEKQTPHEVRLVKVWEPQEGIKEETDRLEDLLAEAFHMAWSEWSQDICEDLDIPEDREERWKDFWETDWENLEENTQEKDYRQVQKFYDLVEERLDGEPEE